MAEKQEDCCRGIIPGSHHCLDIPSADGKFKVPRCNFHQHHQGTIQSTSTPVCTRTRSHTNGLISLPVDAQQTTEKDTVPAYFNALDVTLSFSSSTPSHQYSKSRRSLPNSQTWTANDILGDLPTGLKRKTPSCQSLDSLTNTFVFSTPSTSLPSTKSQWHSQDSESKCSLSDTGYESQLSCSSSDLLNSSHLQSLPTPLPSSTPIYDEILSHFTPSRPEQLIGRKMGLDSFDIIGELHSRNLIIPLQKIFEYLSDEDLFRICRVNSCWQQACHGDFEARRRQEFFTKSRTAARACLQKENICRKIERSRGLTNGKEPFAEVQRVARGQAANVAVTGHAGSIVPKHSRKFSQFCLQAGKLKNDESLRKCPRCCAPAKAHSVQERACCTNSLCEFDFCIKCRASFHGSKDCTLLPPSASSKRRADKVGSKHSKRNLKRL